MDDINYIDIDYENPDGNGNLADKLSDEDRDKIGGLLLQYVKEDIQSRSDWVRMNDEWLKLAAQVVEQKSYPWPDAANVKYPLVTLAAIQFHARSLPNVVNNGSPVKAGINGEDQDGTKQERAQRVATHMNHQLMKEQDNWLDDTDRLLYILPISGQAHRKVYHSSILNRAATKLLTANELIINYDAKTLNKARVTEILELTHNEVASFENSDMIREVKDKVPSRQVEGVQETKDTQDMITGKSAVGGDQDVNFTFYEIHWNWDLDGDGYREPYVFIINASDGQILRIQARWSPNNPPVRNQKTSKIINIKPDDYYIHYFFLPNPASATHGMGFGHLLGPLNAAANTAINALLDSGHINNLQGGFIAKGTKIRGGQLKYRQGYFQFVTTSGQSLRDSIVHLPTKEPSGVLFNLLGMLVNSGERVASISDMMVGETPGQNTPATTSMSVLEQGLKVFTGIYGRIHRTLTKEYNKLFEVNRDYIDVEKINVLLDDGTSVEVLATDYETENMDIRVASDHTLVTDAQKMLRSQSLMEKAQLGVVNPAYAVREALLSEGHTLKQIEEAMTMPEPEPQPEMIKLEIDAARLELETKQAEHDMQMDEIRIKAEAKKDLADQVLKIAKATEVSEQIKVNQLQSIMDQLNKEEEQDIKKIETISKINLESKQGKKLEKEAANAARDSTPKTGGGTSKSNGKG